MSNEHDYVLWFNVQCFYDLGKICCSRRILGVVKFNFVPFSTNTTNSDKIMYERQGHSQAMGANSQCFDIFVMKTIKSKQQLRLSPYSPAVFLVFVQISCPSSWRSSKMERN